MSDTTEPAHVDRRVSFRTPTDTPLECLTVWLWHSSPIQARVQLAWDVWTRVEQAGLFGVDMVDVPSELTPGEAVVLALRFDGSRPQTVERLRMRVANPADPLRTTDSWTATSVRQEITPQDGVPTSDDAGSQAPTTTVESITTLSAGEPAPSGDTVADTLEPVVDALQATHWPFEVDESTRLVLTATLEETAWDVFIEPAETGGYVSTSVYPITVSDLDRDRLEDAVETYNETIDRGELSVDTDTATLRFSTPFDLEAEPLSDVLGENVTAIAEWQHRLATLTASED